MLPWKTMIRIQPASDVPVYLQIAQSIITEIKTGIVKPGMRMPGTRELCGQLRVHRQTVVKAYDDLYAQGWIFSSPAKGTFVSEQLPEIAPRPLPVKREKIRMPEKTAFSFKVDESLPFPGRSYRELIGFHDGPDVRLVPVDELSRTYRSVMTRKSQLHHLSYVPAAGNYELRKALSEHLNESRGLSTGIENILITRGSSMGVYLAAEVLLSKGDKVIVGKPSYYQADLVFERQGAEIIRVDVDDEGIVVEQVEQLCKKKKIRALYVTSHHHYPTTVTLSAARRMKLLALAERYGFIIIEDDYDYDYHYQSSPILPLASADRTGMVIYVGTLSKSIAPALRIGYIAAPKNFIDELTKLRHLIDIQGDPFMEQAVAEMFALGEIRRHMKKALREYHLRRDFMCEMLQDKLGDVIEFKVPDGGVAIWTKYDKKFPIPEVALKLLDKGIALPKGAYYDVSAGKKINCTRMGFGWMNTDEMEKAINVLNDIIRKFK